MKSASPWAVALLASPACAPAQPPPTAAAPPPRPAVVRSVRSSTTSAWSEHAGTPAEQGLRPWWLSLPAGLYARPDGPAVMAVGRSEDHHHPAEGFLNAKVRARLAVRRAAGQVAFQDSMPEPYLEDLFITPERTFWALYRLDVPGNAGLPDDVAAWTVPEPLRGPGRRRVGRHTFEDWRHLYLECDVEGPVANPDWGQTRVSAQLIELPRRDR